MLPGLEYAGEKGGGMDVAEWCKLLFFRYISDNLFFIGISRGNFCAVVLSSFCLLHCECVHRGCLFPSQGCGVFALLELSAAIVTGEDVVCCFYQRLMVCPLSVLVSAHISFIPQLYSLFVMLVVSDVDDWPSDVLGRSMIPLKSSRCSPGIMSNARTSLIRSSL